MLSIHTSIFTKLLLKAYDLKNIIFKNFIKKENFREKEKVMKNISLDFFCGGDIGM